MIFLKYIFWIAIGIVVIIALVITMFAYNANAEYYRGRFLLTITVKIAGRIKSVQSVYEVAYNRRRKPSPGSGGLISDFKGAMPQMDMGSKGSFVVAGGYVPNIHESKDCYWTGFTRLPTTVMSSLKDDDFTESRELVDAMRTATGVFSTGKFSLVVIYVPFGGSIQDYKAFPLCDLEKHAGVDTQLVDITIQHTDLPVETEIREPLRWIVDWREQFQNVRQTNPRWSDSSVWPYPRPDILQFPGKTDT